MKAQAVPLPDSSVENLGRPWNRTQPTPAESQGVYLQAIQEDVHFIRIVVEILVWLWVASIVLAIAAALYLAYRERL